MTIEQCGISSKTADQWEHRGVKMAVHSLIEEMAFANQRLAESVAGQGEERGCTIHAYQEWIRFGFQPDKFEGICNVGFVGKKVHI